MARPTPPVIELEYGMLNFTSGRGPAPPPAPSLPPPSPVPPMYPDRITRTQLHPHTLQKRNPHQTFSNGQWQCSHCSNSTTIGMKFEFYSCQTCTYYLCGKCSISPVHAHPLQVVDDTPSIYPDYNGHWACDVCHGQTTEGMVSYMHHCGTCSGFDVCDKCLNIPPPSPYSTFRVRNPGIPTPAGMLHVTSGKGGKTFNMKPPINPRVLNEMTTEELAKELQQMRTLNHDPQLQFS
eukprot:TRINITY_DN4322_c0_g1_i2.p1 TRINITY_DN4322_c0_g1~~TRINITY_DN4322_c0_g1_i2.p1  ORF type:complete len:236 (+),score=13.81 TRINITY_DN4322_c0_g1_i2:140-847(+)